VAVVYIGGNSYLYNQIFAVRVIEILRFAQYDKYHVICHSERSEESQYCILESVVKLKLFNKTKLLWQVERI
jgi:hypothetical protein